MRRSSSAGPTARRAAGGPDGHLRAAPPPAGPTFPPGTIRIIDEVSGISYPFLGDGWYEWALWDQAETTETAGQYFTTQELTPDGNTFISQCSSGPLADGYGWAGPVDPAVDARHRRRQRPRQLLPGAERADGAARRGRARSTVTRAHLYEFQLAWDVPGYDASGERAALLLIDVGRPAPALLYISIPNTHAELYGVIDRVLDAVDVL